MSFKFLTDSHVILHADRSVFVNLFARFRQLYPGHLGLPAPEASSFYQSLPHVLERFSSDVSEPVLDALLQIEALAANPNPAPDLCAQINPNHPESHRLELAIRLWLEAHPVAPTSDPVAQVSEPAVSQASEPASAKNPSVDQFNSGPPVGPLSSNGQSGSDGGEGQGEEAFPIENQNSKIQNPTPAPIQNQKSKTETPDDFLRLAQLSAPDYERVRLAEAKRLRFRVGTLDAEVARIRNKMEIQAQTDAIHLPNIEPWPKPVDGAELLCQVRDCYDLYLVLPSGAAIAIALWTAQAHIFHLFHLSPRLNLASETGGCGKTTALDVIATMVPRAIRLENLSPAVLFRLVDLVQPTLLLDEVDTYLRAASELRGLLNAGHKRNSHAFRCEGENYLIRAFNAFAPAVLAGIGPLPATLRDRSIIIWLVAAEPGRQPARFNPLKLENESVLARKLARWTKDNAAAIAACDPPLPASAINRVADNWRPLFAIAQVAGGDWPALALESFNHLAHGTNAFGRDSIMAVVNSTHLLLSDLRSIFQAAGADRLFSSDLVAALALIPNRPWSNGHNGKPLTEALLARRLGGLGISSRLLRINGTRARGFDVSDLNHNGWDAASRVEAESRRRPVPGVPSLSSFSPAWDDVGL